MTAHDVDGFLVPRSGQQTAARVAHGHASPRPTVPPGDDDLLLAVMRRMHVAVAMHGAEGITRDRLLDLSGSPSGTARVALDALEADGLVVRVDRERVRAGKPFHTRVTSTPAASD